MADINIRELVVESLLELDKEEIYLSALEKAVLDKYDYIDSRDKSFYKRLLDGTVEMRIRIDYILGLFSSVKINKMKPYVRMVMRMSIYQIMWMDNVPDSAACNEAVKLVSKRGLGGLKGFVNGVLRNIGRNKDSITYPDPHKDHIKYMSVMYSCPEWIVAKLESERGAEITEKILADSMKEHPLSILLRINGDARANLLKKWSDSGIAITPNEKLEYALFLSNTGSVASLPGYNEGHFIVQDTGSMLVAHMAGIKSGDVVMDVCAAPGGKSIHASDILTESEKQNAPQNPGKIYSFDVSPERCDRISENIQRLNITNITVEAHDATVIIPGMSEAADVVIVDAPCSGLGVMGHKNDIKYRIKPEDITSLCNLQRNIIDTAVRYVKPGGRFVYSTCTVSRQENEEQMKYILDKYSFSVVENEDGRECTQLIPGVDASDGFFIVVLERR